MKIIHLSQNALEWEEAHAFQVVHANTVTSLLLDVFKAAYFHWSIIWIMLFDRLILVDKVKLFFKWLQVLLFFFWRCNKKNSTF